MKMTRRSSRLLATVAAVSLVLAACGGDDDSGDVTDDTTATTDDGGATATTEAGGTTDATTAPTDAMTDETTAPSGDVTTIAYGAAQEFSNYNNGLASSNSSKNTLVLTQVLPSPFNFEGPTGDLAMDDELMDSVTVTSTDPQVIEAVINADAVWSDGEPIDCDDAYFAWASATGKYKQLDDAGNVVTDPDSGAELLLFDVVGTGGYEDIESLECSDDGKTITTTYSTVYADWRALFTQVLPAHVIERESGVPDLIAAFENEDMAAITAMADFFNTGWSTNPGELNKDIIPSGGKLMIDSWEAGSSLTLVPNPNYWGTPANGPVILRYIAEEAQAQALANGEINVMDPQPSVDLLAQLNGIDGIEVQNGTKFTWEHFDFNFRNEALANPMVREAFAYCLPRQQMVTNLIDPLSPGAIILNNRLNQEFEAGYVDSTGGKYDQVDLVKAQQLSDDSGVAQPIDLRLGWFDNGGNARRTDQVALTIESCNQVGFNIVDNGSETFFDVELSAGDWDIAMFAWAGSPLKSGQDALYNCDGGANNGLYCNPEVDALTAAINQELDAQTQIDLANQLDAILWTDLPSIPVFSFPGVAAWSSNISNVVYNPSNNQVMWNAASWQAT